MSTPRIVFGAVADVQYADHADALNYSQTKMRLDSL
jgi:hypothetical protein